MENPDYTNDWKLSLFKEPNPVTKIHCFLSPSVVRLVSKISIHCQLTPFIEFSIMDTMEYAFNNCKEFMKHGFDQQRICMFLLYLLKISVKYNDASNMINGCKFNDLFPFEIDVAKFKNFEFETLQELDFKVTKSQLQNVLYIL